MSTQRDGFIYLIAGLGLAICFSILAIVVARGESTVQRDAPTVRFYTPDGKSAGSATTYGNQTIIYGPDGKHIGTTVRSGDPRLDPNRRPR